MPKDHPKTGTPGLIDNTGDQGGPGTPGGGRRRVEPDGGGRALSVVSLPIAWTTWEAGSSARPIVILEQ